MPDNPDYDAQQEKSAPGATIDGMGKAVGGNAVIERRIASGHGLSASDGHALAGLVDAEGHFATNANNRGAAWSCSFSSVRVVEGRAGGRWTLWLTCSGGREKAGLRWAIFGPTARE